MTKAAESIILNKSIDFDHFPSIGEYVPGAHWKDLPLTKKVQDIAISLFKLLLVVAIIGIITFFAIPSPFAPLITILVIGIILVTGLTLIAHSTYKLHCPVSYDFPSISLGSSAPLLGKWSKNNIMVTQNGRESMEMKLRLIKSAERSIEISGNFCGGDIFDTMLDAIQVKLLENPNLEVRILSSSALLTPNNLKKINLLKEKYDNFTLIKCDRKFMFFPSFRSVENHIKLLLVDNVHCVTGGTGIQDMLSRDGDDLEPVTGMNAFLGRGAKDMDVVISGPLAETMRHQFYRLFYKWSLRMGMDFSVKSYSTSTINEQEMETARRKSNKIFEEREGRMHKGISLAALVGSYEHGTKNPCLEAYIRAIQAAKDTITLCHMNFSHKLILTELENAFARGVKIRIVTNMTDEIAPIGISVINVVNRYALEKLVRIGLDCYAYRRESVLYHKKVAIFDNQISIIGSFNFTRQAAEILDENIVLINSREVAEDFLQNIDLDLVNSTVAKKSSWFKNAYNQVVSRIVLFFTNYVFQ